MKYFLHTAETIPEGVGFTAFGPVHLAWLAVFAVFTVFCCLIYRRTKEKRAVRISFAALLLADELFKVICLIIGGRFMAKYLPLHLCSVNVFVIALHAFKPTKVVDNLLYTVCLPAALAALLFPSWASLPFGNFMHMHSFTVHILLAAYPCVLLAGGDIRPQAKWIPACIGMLVALAVVMYPVNLLLDTNFLFLMYPEDGNPFVWFEQQFGSHLIGYPVIIAAILVVMYVPLGIIRRIRARKMPV